MTKKSWTIAFIIIFIVALIPIYVVGFFAHPSVDDYFYGAETARIWSETHSFGAVLSESLRFTQEAYVGWQGNWAAILLMQLQPGIFSESLYVLAPILLITSFVASMLFFFVTVLRRLLNAERRTSWVIAMAITFTALQMTYRPSDSFYWFNGSIYYTFFFSLMLCLFSLISILLHTDSKAVRIITFVLCCLLIFLIGGGNFATSLFTMVVMSALVVFYTWYHCSKGLHKSRCIFPIILLLIGICSLMVTVLAPGNAVRQEGVGGHTGLLKTFAYTFAYGGYNIASATTLPVFVMWLLLLPEFYKIAKRTPFRFRYPLAVLLLSFGIFCSQGTPVFYAQGLRMPYRMMNIIYFAYYPFVAFNLIYLMGWLARREEAKPGIIMSKIEHCYDRTRSCNVILIVGIILFSLGCIGRIQVSEAAPSEDTQTTLSQSSASFSNMPLSVSATYALLSGNAAAYDRELTERDAYLRSTNEDSVELSPLSVTPEPIFHSDITSDPTHWKNEHLKMFYHIEEIYIR